MLHTMRCMQQVYDGLLTLSVFMKILNTQQAFWDLTENLPYVEVLREPSVLTINTAVYRYVLLCMNMHICDCVQESDVQDYLDID